MDNLIKSARLHSAGQWLRILPVIGVCLCICLTHMAFGETVDTDRIVAVVNDEVITLYDLNEVIRPFVEKIKSSGYSPAEEQKAIFQLREAALNDLIDQKLAQQEAKRFKITVDDNEVDAAIERIKEGNSMTDEQLRRSIAARDMTYAEFRAKIREGILRTRLINFQIKSKTVVTKDDIKRYYESHAAEYAGETLYHLKNIFLPIPPDADSATREQLKARMQHVHDQLTAGTDFDHLSDTQKSGSPAMISGDLGKFKLSELSAALQPTIAPLAAGQFTDVIVLEQGLQIVQVVEISRTPPKSLAEATPAIETTLYNDEINQKFKTWIKELRQRSYVKIIR